MSETDIRPATTGDAEQVAGLLGELGYPSASGFAEDKLGALSASPGDTVLVAEREGQVVGVVHLHAGELFHELGKLGRVMAIIVHPGSRHHGVGRRLMEAVEQAATQAGCNKVEVTSGIYREGAHRFYRSLGYAETSKRFVKSLD